jgi:hypothetical protein
MKGATRRRPAGRAPGQGVNAVTWMEPGMAVIARGRRTGDVAVQDVPLPLDKPPALAVAIAEVAHRVGDVDQVLVLGDDDLRIALEREIVAIGHRPEWIREEPVRGPIDREWLVSRLRRLG